MEVVRITTGIIFKLGSADLCQNLAAIHFGQVQVQQDKIRAKGMQVGTFMPQKSHGLDSVHNHVQMDEGIGFTEGFLGQPNISGIVFDQENLYRHTVAADQLHDFLSFHKPHYLCPEAQVISKLGLGLATSPWSTRIH